MYLLCDYNCHLPVRLTAGAAVIFPQNRATAGIFGKALKKGFTLLEVLVVVVIIGILSSLAYSGFMDLIFTNNAKETAQTMRTFIERALAESKRQQIPVTISVVGNNIRYTGDGGKNYITVPLSGGFQGNSGAASTIDGVSAYKNQSTASRLKIGLSGIDTAGFFAACGAKGYCGAAVKTENNNSFTAWIRRGSSASWEEL